MCGVLMMVKVVMRAVSVVWQVSAEGVARSRVNNNNNNNMCSFDNSAEPLLEGSG